MCAVFPEQLDSLRLSAGVEASVAQSLRALTNFNIDYAESDGTSLRRLYMSIQLGVHAYAKKETVGLHAMMMLAIDSASVCM